MRTVQEYFREVNEERLIRYYLYKYPVKLDEISDETMTIKAAKELIWDKLRQYIERLRSMEIETVDEGEECILFYHKKIEKELPDDASSLVCVSELMEKKDEAEIYNYMFTSQAKILGFYVADTYQTQDNIIELLTDVMHTASFLGFEQEHLQEEIDKVTTEIEKVESGNTKYHSVDELKDWLGLRKKRRDPAEVELMKM